MLEKITAIVLIGNSDNKLTQKEWSDFVTEVRELIWIFEKETHFVGSSEPFSQYQTGCFVFELKEKDLTEVKQGLILRKDKYKQNFIALIVGNTQLI